MPRITGNNSAAPLGTQTPTTPSSHDSQPVRQSSSRPTGSGELSGLKRRDDVTNQAASHMEQPGATYYSAAVFGVSTVLGQNKLGITKGSHDSVLGNLEGISQGKQTHTGAHMNESKSFGQDAFAHLQRGEYRDAAVTAAGSVLNAAASMTVGPARDFETARKNPDLKISTAAAASLHQDFATLPSPTRD
jgi:hypothetical protein